jgi:hypothetical protein
MGRVYSLPEEYQFTPTQPRCCSDVDRNTVSYGLVHRRTAQATTAPVTDLVVRPQNKHLCDIVVCWDRDLVISDP